MSKFVSPDLPFIKAVRDLDLAHVRALLIEDPSLVDIRVRGDYSLSGADCEDGQHMGPLQFAAFYGHTELAKLLIEFGAHVDAVVVDNRNSEDGETTAIQLAAWEGSVAVLRVLLEAARTSGKLERLASPLYAAASHRDLAKVQLLVEFGAVHNLHTAAMVGDLEMVKQFLDENPEAVNQEHPKWGSLPIRKALACAQTDVVALLVERGAELSPDVAAGLGRNDFLFQLLAADPAAVQNQFNTKPLLIWAILGGQLETMKMLLDSGANPNGVDEWGVSALREAAELRGPRGTEMVELLLTAGADPNRVSRFIAPIVSALGNLQSARTLLRFGADVNVRSHENQTPLHYAVAADRPSALERVEFLVDAGADRELVNDANQRPVEVARQRQLNDVVELLERAI